MGVVLAVTAANPRRGATESAVLEHQRRAGAEFEYQHRVGWSDVVKLFKIKSNCLIFAQVRHSA